MAPELRSDICPFCCTSRASWSSFGVVDEDSSTEASALGLDAIDVVANPRAGLDAGFFFFFPPAIMSKFLLKIDVTQGKIFILLLTRG